jgi:hypothetical protein
LIKALKPLDTVDTDVWATYSGFKKKPLINGLKKAGTAYLKPLYLLFLINIVKA